MLLPKLEQYSALLKCLVVSEELEVAALYGVPALVRHLQHPPGELSATREGSAGVRRCCVVRNLPGEKFGESSGVMVSSSHGGYKFREVLAVVGWGGVEVSQYFLLKLRRLVSLAVLYLVLRL